MSRHYECPRCHRIVNSLVIDESSVRDPEEVRPPLCCLECAAPPISGASDPEGQSRLDAKRVTLEFGQKSRRKLDRGRRPIEDSPLFGGDRQEKLF